MEQLDGMMLHSMDEHLAQKEEGYGEVYKSLE